jgi:mono/diheme cytochrome c family protein
VFKRLTKIAGWLVLALTGTVMALVALVNVRQNRTFEAPYPRIQASTDPKVIERGRYLAYGPAHCVNCHTGMDKIEAVKAGAMLPLTGGHEFKLPFGTVYSPNLTPDAETGIGRYSDAELARIIRHGVKPDGRVVLPFMEVQDLSDEDLVAVISFLRSQEPVRNAVPRHEFNVVGKAILSFLMKPVGPSGPVRPTTPPEGTVERGQYLATVVAGCDSCHTKRNLLNGEFIGEKFAGGFEFEIPGEEEKVMVTPNLTPASTGRITTWDEEQFVGRFGAGVGLPHSHKPWRQFQKMS